MPGISSPATSLQGDRCLILRVLWPDGQYLRSYLREGRELAFSDLDGKRPRDFDTGLIAAFGIVAVP